MSNLVTAGETQLRYRFALSRDLCGRALMRAARWIPATAWLVAFAGACGSEDAREPFAPRDTLFTIGVAEGAGQRSFTGEYLSSAVGVRVRHAGSGLPGSGVSVRFSVGVGGGAIGDTIVVTNSFGDAGTTWRLGSVPGRQSIIASLASGRAASDTITADAVDPAQADLIVIRGGGSSSVIAVLFSSADSPEVYSPVQPDTVVRLLPRDSSSLQWLVAFSSGRQPGFDTVTWTAGPDTAAVVLPAPFAVPLAIWIMDNYDRNAALVRRDADTTPQFWRDFRFGLAVGPLQIRDATAYAVGILDCSGAAQLPADSAMINVYYATGAVPPYGGYECSPRTIIVNAASDFPRLLVHELGHAFGLGHVTDPSNFMNQNAPRGGSATLGQVFLAHFTSYSALNQVYGLHPQAEWCDSDLSPGCLRVEFGPP